MNHKNHRFEFLVIILIWTGMSAIPLFGLGQFASLQNWQNSHSLQYQPDYEVFVVHDFAIRYRGDETPFFVTFSPGASGSFSPRQAFSASGTTIDYYIHDSTTARNILKDLAGSPAAEEVLSGILPETGGAFTIATIPLSYAIVLIPGQLPRPGTYTDTIQVTFWTGTITNPGQQFESRALDILIQMPTVTEISVVPSGNPFSIDSTTLTLDYGILSIGEIRDVDIVVRSNVSYSVHVSSLGGGRLMPEDPDDPDYVPYRISSDNESINLEAGIQTQLATGPPSTSVAGSRHGLSFEILDFGMALEGRYSDTLMFTIAAQ